VLEATDERNAIIRLPANTTICARCGVSTEPLYFRRFRRVIGAGWIDFIRNRPGYFCNRCRRTLFFQWQGFTLLLGWWGLFALLFRNPWAIGINFRALVAPPKAPERWGAVTIEQLAEAAKEGVALEDLRVDLRSELEVVTRSRNDEVRDAWEHEEIDPTQLDRITRRALRKAKRI
jgi:hypothetical protein